MRVIPPCPAESIALTPSQTSLNTEKRRYVCLPQLTGDRPPRQSTPRSNANMSRNCPLPSPMHFYAAFSGMNLEGRLTKSIFTNLYMQTFVDKGKNYYNYSGFLL
jgi:hypothetical protein